MNKKHQKRREEYAYVMTGAKVLDISNAKYARANRTVDWRDFQLIGSSNKDESRRKRGRSKQTSVTMQKLLRGKYVRKRMLTLVS